MTLPVSPPVKPMLAKVRDDVPRDEGWVYEPKWDGFRAIVYRDGDELWLRSRNDRPLDRYFPELVGALRDALPATCVVDGEIVLPTDGALDFDALQLRLHPAASRVELLASQTPTSFVAFDLLGLGDRDLCAESLVTRWDLLAPLLEEPSTASAIAETPAPHVMLTPRTTDPDVAERWFTELEALGVDGIIAKRTTLPYSPGKRVMAKIKHRRVADCVVVGYRLSKKGDGIGSLLLGVHDDSGTLHYIGHTSSFKARERRELLEMLEPMRTDDDHGMGRAPGGPSRWTQGKDMEWYPVESRLVCEVAYDFLQQNRFRHASTFLRWREDKPPSECTFDQLDG